MPPKRKQSPPKYSPPRRQRRAVPSGAARRPRDIFTPVDQPRLTDRERRAIHNEMGRIHRFGTRVTSEGYQSYMRPFYTRFVEAQRRVDELTAYMNRVGQIEFVNVGAMGRLQSARNELERARQDYIYQKSVFERQYVDPIRESYYFWEDQYRGGPPGSPPPPPPGLIR